MIYLLVFICCVFSFGVGAALAALVRNRIIIEQSGEISRLRYELLAVGCDGFEPVGPTSMFEDWCKCGRHEREHRR